MWSSRENITCIQPCTELRTFSWNVIEGAVCRNTNVRVRCRHFQELFQPPGKISGTSPSQLMSKYSRRIHSEQEGASITFIMWHIIYNIYIYTWIPDYLRYTFSFVCQCMCCSVLQEIQMLRGIGWRKPLVVSEVLHWARGGTINTLALLWEVLLCQELEAEELLTFPL